MTKRDAVPGWVRGGVETDASQSRPGGLGCDRACGPAVTGQNKSPDRAYPGHRILIVINKLMGESY